MSNTASVTTTTPDTNANNDRSTATAAVQPSANLSVTKIGAAEGTPGRSTTYTIVATNAGPGTDANAT